LSGGPPLGQDGRLVDQGVRLDWWAGLGTRRWLRIEAATTKAAMAAMPIRTMGIGDPPVLLVGSLLIVAVSGGVGVACG
jgi:hypothetical protein